MITPPQPLPSSAADGEKLPSYWAFFFLSSANSEKFYFFVLWGSIMNNMRIWKSS